MTYLQAYELGAYYPMAIKVLAEKKEKDKGLKNLLNIFLEYVEKFDLNNTNGENDFSYFASERFLDRVQAKLSTSEEPLLYYAWLLGKSISALDWMIRHNGDESVINGLKLEALNALKKLSINYILDDTSNALVDLKELIKKKDMEKDSKMSINIDNLSNSGSLQIGAENIQNIDINNITIGEFIKKIQESDLEDNIKSDLISQIKKILEHPLVVSIIGALAGSAI